MFLLLSFLVTRRRLCLSGIKKSLWLLLASGAAMGINWMLLFEAYQYTTISLATLSYYLAPVIVTALCPLLFHEKMTRASSSAFSCPRSASHSSSAPAACMAARRTCAASALA
ncbi:MAG: EamA family transporter [Oscillospiraceae bacterium]